MTTEATNVLNDFSEMTVGEVKCPLLTKTGETVTTGFEATVVGDTIIVVSSNEPSSKTNKSWADEESDDEDEVEDEVEEVIETPLPVENVKEMISNSLDEIYWSLCDAIFNGVAKTQNGYLDSSGKETRITPELVVPKQRRTCLESGKKVWTMKLPLAFFHLTSPPGDLPVELFTEPGFEDSPWIYDPHQVCIRFLRWMQTNFPDFRKQIRKFKVLPIMDGVHCIRWKIDGDLAPAISVEFEWFDPDAKKSHKKR